MDAFVFFNGFNLANMSYQMVELGSFNPISTSWTVKFAKLNPLSLELGCLMSLLWYPKVITYLFGSQKWVNKI